ncbi:MAG TPA: hypothetical protein VNV43_10610 [Candidatus Acidoferrales bacterium]|jgi:hypothetical protein|nr:hypothetical protein [Candidatus Acidoferrales bacterium]
MISSQIAPQLKIESGPVLEEAVRLLRIISVFVVFCTFNTVKAAVITATNASLSAVQAAVNSANPGDTVNIPAGTAVWSSSLKINSDIQLIGAGIGKTVIFDGGSPNSIQVINWNTQSNGFCRLSGVEFYGTNNGQEWSGTVALQGYCHAFRLDHCEFFGLDNYNIFANGWVYGCVDHNLFYETYWAGAIEDEMQNYGNQYGYGDGSWADSDNWGTTNALYIEANVFTNGYACLDTLSGARVVFRYNAVTNTWVVSHGTETGGRERSFRLYEVYENNFYYDFNSKGVLPEAVYLRGGTAVIFSNIFSGGYEYPVEVAAYRQWINNWSPWGYSAGWDGVSPWNPIDTNNPHFLDAGTASSSSTSSLTDTSKNWGNNQWTGLWLVNSNTGIATAIDGNNSDSLTLEPGYDAVSGSGNSSGGNITFSAGQTYLIFSNVATIDQPGRGQGDLMADTVAGNGIPYDTVTGKTNWPNEVSDPIYEWNNNMSWSYPNGDYAQANYIIAENSGIVSNRDYIDGVPKPGYTPLVYPHPLDTTNGFSSPSTFPLTVVYGGGSGQYPSNSVVSISADTTNETFILWNGTNIVNTNLADTTVTMPPYGLTVTALCKPYPPAFTTNAGGP